MSVLIQKYDNPANTARNGGMNCLTAQPDTGNINRAIMLQIKKRASHRLTRLFKAIFESYFTPTRTSSRMRRARVVLKMPQEQKRAMVSAASLGVRRFSLTKLIIFCARLIESMP